MQKRLFLVLALLLLLCCFCVHLFAEEPSTVPAAEYGEGIYFGENAGRYMLEKDMPTMPLTFEATMYFPRNADASLPHTILSNYERDTNGFTFEITKEGHPSLMFYEPGSVTTTYTFSTVSVYNDARTHIALVADGENLHCYVNGELAETLALALNPLEYSPRYTNLGTDHRCTNVCVFRGALLNVACYADVRTAAEVKADMTEQGTDNLLLHFDMTESRYGEDVLDLSAEGNRAIYEHFWYDEIDNITDYAYSIAVVGDTQYNVKYQPNTFAKLYDWLVANTAEKKIAFMLGLGDITDDDSEVQWEHATKNIAKLDGVLPYALTRGNHDGTTATYTEKFANSGYAAAIGENYYFNLTNTYQTFRQGKNNYLVLALNYNPSAKVIDWAKGVAEAHPYHRVIVITHSYLTETGTHAGPGQRCWDGFIKDCPNVEMVFSGHVFNDKILTLESKGSAGNIVKQFMINGQCVDSTLKRSGKEVAGLVAMLYFDESGNNVKFEYYSTALDKYFMACNQFTATVGNLAGDADFNGKITVADTLMILKAYMNGAVCYNGDVNGDLRLTFTDVLATLRVATR